MPVRVGRVGHGVVRADVVERALQRGPDVLLQVGDVVEVERLDQLAGDHLVEVVGRHLGHVGRDRAGGERRDPRVDVVERRDLDLDVVLLAELLEQLPVDVVRVVEDGEGAAGLGLEARGDRLLPQRQRHSLVGPRQRIRRPADRLGRVRTRAQNARCPRESECGTAASAEELSAICSPVQWMHQPQASWFMHRPRAARSQALRGLPPHRRCSRRESPRGSDRGSA